MCNARVSETDFVSVIPIEDLSNKRRSTERLSDKPERRTRHGASPADVIQSARNDLAAERLC
jgi:hypothetical protein